MKPFSFRVKLTAKQRAQHSHFMGFSIVRENNGLSISKGLAFNLLKRDRPSLISILVDIP